jgi:hypothetical protein
MLADDPERELVERFASILSFIPVVAEGRIDHDAGPERHVVGPRPHSVHDSCDVRATDVRHRRFDREPATHPEVEVVHGGGFHLHAHLSGSRLRDRHLPNLNYLGTAEVLEDGSTHGPGHPVTPTQGFVTATKSTGSPIRLTTDGLARYFFP